MLATSILLRKTTLPTGKPKLIGTGQQPTTSSVIKVAKTVALNQPPFHRSGTFSHSLSLFPTKSGRTEPPSFVKLDCHFSSVESAWATLSNCKLLSLPTNICWSSKTNEWGRFEPTLCHQFFRRQNQRNRTGSTAIMHRTQSAIQVPPKLPIGSP